MVKRVFICAFCCLLVLSLGPAAAYFAFNDNLPDLDELERFQPKRVSKVFSADGQHLKNFLEEDREILSYEEIPQAMKDALIAIEDRRFFDHWGIDIWRIFGAVRDNLLSFSLTTQGASTITQQLAGNLFKKVGRYRSTESVQAVKATFVRKIREQITAVNIERLYTKQEILTMYLNTVTFGHNRYGLKSAAGFYFGKEVNQLNVEECALLAGLLKAPTAYSPVRSLEKARERRNVVLYSMVETGALRRGVYNTLKRTPVALSQNRRAETYGMAPYFIEEYLRQQLEREFGQGLYQDGLNVQTTIDSRLQRVAEKVLVAELAEVQKRVDEYLNGQRGPRPDSAIVQGAMVVMDLHNGQILAMVGGRDFEESKYNRATQALRQPGSAFKPFIYTAAIDNGRFAIDLVEDNAMSFPEPDGKIWKPENYDKEFKGTITLRQALKESRNLATIALAKDIGPDRVQRYAQQMGITTPIAPVLSIGLGTSAVHLLDLVAAYCVFANKGIYHEPVGIRKVLGEEGNVLYEPPSFSREALNPAVAAIMTDMLRSVVAEPGGTAYQRAQELGFKVAAAGKTGTTDSYGDAWFVGFTPHLVAGVWVGMDDQALSLWPRQSGAVAALPMWLKFMQEVYRTVDPYRRDAGKGFEYSEDLVMRLPVCQDSHKLATRYCPRQQEELFARGGALPDPCPQHGRGGTPGRRQRF
ncbi:MAG: PBP1A family penicillin-binding protein [Candidatus Handelsmanbacteria bacterium]|nr:PBP1A family penicillin-binding protein [Candidatus Handelsmanbacteria bacterium]